MEGRIESHLRHAIRDTADSSRQRTAQYRKLDETHHTYGQKLLGEWRKDKDIGEEVFVEQGIKKVR